MGKVELSGLICTFHPSSLCPWVQIPSTPSKLFLIFVFFLNLYNIIPIVRSGNYFLIHFLSILFVVGLRKVNRKLKNLSQVETMARRIDNRQTKV